MTALQFLVYRYEFTHVAKRVSTTGNGLDGSFFILILIIFLIFICGQGYILFTQCDEEAFLTCALGILTSDEDEPAPEGSVTATGALSGEFEGESRSVSVSITFPLNGVEVTGSFSGDCDGTIKGTYAGGDGGTISGKGNGSCVFVIPAAGNFSGSVNQSAKTVTVSGSGSAAGFSKSGSLTLTY